MLMLKWFRQARNRNIPFLYPLVQIKTEKFVSGLGKSGFKASTGLLNGFKERNRITFKSVCCKSARSCKSLEGQCSSNDRGDSSKRHFQCRQNRFVPQVYTGQNLNSVGVNMDGTEKLPLLTIGKSAKLRCFKTIKSKPIDYKANKKALITISLLTIALFIKKFHSWAMLRLYIFPPTWHQWYSQWIKE